MATTIRLLPNNTLAERRENVAALPYINPQKGMGTWKWLIDVQPPYDPATQTLAATGFTVDGDTVTITYTITAKPRPEILAPIAQSQTDALVMREVETLRSEGKRVEALELLLKHKGVI